MDAASTAPLRVALRADASQSMGVGHVSRCLALADEISDRGGTPLFFGSVEVPWLEESMNARGLQVRDAPTDPIALAHEMIEAGIEVVVLDGYTLDQRSGSALQSAGVTVLAIQDGSFGAGQDADLILDQNVTANTDHVPTGSIPLLGLSFTLFRDEVLTARSRADAATKLAESGAQADKPLHGVVFCGGTDPREAAALLAEMVLESHRPVVLTVVAASESMRSDLARLHLGEGQQLNVIDPTPDIIEIAGRSDFAVIAAGSSVWELMCVGTPSAIVAVADNQQPTLAAVLESGAALPLGLIAEMRSDSSAYRAAAEQVAHLVTSREVRHSLRRRSRELIDGDGRKRVLDELERVVDAHRNSARARMTATDQEAPSP